ncbi:MAG: hypothetical protein JXB47_15805 [Anaerolineae bacterium]|nr:hypothetical protein [Anaerolineae bacterium]
MIAIISVFWIALIVFAIIGMLRGWAKEIIATAGIVLALFALKQFGGALFTPVPSAEAVSMTPALEAQLSNEFVVRMVFFLGVAFFAYQTPAAAELWAAKRTGGSGRKFEWLSQGLQQSILGFVIGFVNGWLVVGTVWWYADYLRYPFGEYVIPPGQLDRALTALGYPPLTLHQTTMAMINALPMAVLGDNDIVLPLLVVILFLFVIIVMI